MMTFLRATVCSLALAAATTAAPALARAAEGPAAADRFHATTLELSAYGETKIAPDMATLRLGVVAQASTAAEAMASGAAQMNRVLEALRAAGVPAREVQTSSLNLSPQYAYGQNQPPRLTGYQASEDLTVQVHDLAKLGPVVDATVAAGANQVNGINLSLADPTAAQNAAREQAVHALQAKAELYARATGYRLVRLVSLSEGGGQEPSPPRPLMMGVAEARVAKVPVATGELDVRVDIAGVFELSR